MQRLLFLAAALFAVGIACLARAQLPFQGAAWTPVTTAGYTGLLDIVSGAVGCYSLQPCDATIAAAAGQSGTKYAALLKNRSSSETCQAFLNSDGSTATKVKGCSSSTADGTLITTFCSGTSACAVSTWYNQCAYDAGKCAGTTAGDVLSTTGADMIVIQGPPLHVQWFPLFTDAACTSGTISMPLPFSLSLVAKIDSANLTTGQGDFLSVEATAPQRYQVGHHGVNKLFVYNGTEATATAGVDDTKQQATQVTVQTTGNSGATSEIYVDGTGPTTVTGGPPGAGNATAEVLCIGGFVAGSVSNQWVGTMDEVGVYQGSTAVTAFQAAYSTINSNQHTRFGF